MPVLSGSANAGAPFDVRADRPAGESAYAALVRLVEQAQTQRAPFVRMADRYAGFFLPATILVAGLAWAHQRRPGPGARRRRRRDAVPADPRRADRARLRSLPRGASRRDRQGRRRDRDARRGPDGPVRQDRHADGRDARGARDRHPRGLRLRRAAATRRVARPSVRPRPRRSARRGRRRRRAGADDAARRPRGARSGDPGDRRRSPRRGREPGVHALRRDPGCRACVGDARHHARVGRGARRRRGRRPRRRRDRDGRRAPSRRRSTSSSGSAPRASGTSR